VPARFASSPTEPSFVFAGNVILGTHMSVCSHDRHLTAARRIFERRLAVLSDTMRLRGAIPAFFIISSARPRPIDKVAAEAALLISLPSCRRKKHLSRADGSAVIRCCAVAPNGSDDLGPLRNSRYAVKTCGYCEKQRSVAPIGARCDARRYIFRALSLRRQLSSRPQPVDMPSGCRG